MVLKKKEINGMFGLFFTNIFYCVVQEKKKTNKKTYEANLRTGAILCKLDSQI